MTMNVVKNWPFGGALEDSARPAPGVTIEEGMVCKKIAHPTKAGEIALRPVDVAGAGDTGVNTPIGVVVFALDRDAAFDVVDADRIPFIEQNAKVETDQLAAGATFTAADVGAVVYASATEAGMVTHDSASGIEIGRFDGLSTLEDTNGDPRTAWRINFAVA